MTPAWFSYPLIEGDTGEAVLIIQRKLKVPMTGLMDLTTCARLRGFQRWLGLEETGAVDRRTAEALGDKASVGSAPAWFSRPLSVGDHGPDVAHLCSDLGLLPHTRFTPDVSQAVRRFQSSAGLTPTGTVCRDTATALADRTA